MKVSCTEAKGTKRWHGPGERKSLTARCAISSQQAKPRRSSSPTKFHSTWRPRHTDISTGATTAGPG